MCEGKSIGRNLSFLLMLRLKNRLKLFIISLKSKILKMIWICWTLSNICWMKRISLWNQIETCLNYISKINLFLYYYLLINFLLWVFIIQFELSLLRLVCLYLHFFLLFLSLRILQKILFFLIVLTVKIHLIKYLVLEIHNEPFYYRKAFLSPSLKLEN